MISIDSVELHVLFLVGMDMILLGPTEYIIKYLIPYIYA